MIKTALQDESIYLTCDMLQHLEVYYVDARHKPKIQTKSMKTALPEKSTAKKM